MIINKSQFTEADVKKVRKFAKQFAAIIGDDAAGSLAEIRDEVGWHLKHFVKIAEQQAEAEYSIRFRFKTKTDSVIEPGERIEAVDPREFNRLRYDDATGCFHKEGEPSLNPHFCKMIAKCLDAGGECEIRVEERTAEEMTKHLYLYLKDFRQSAEKDFCKWLVAEIRRQGWSSY